MILDEIAAAAEQLKRDQQRQNIAQMADEIERIKAEDWKPPECANGCPAYQTCDHCCGPLGPDVEHIPEQPAPLDWLLQEQFAKARREAHHLELTPED